ncbi:MAG: hypothetical protein GKR89_01490 [Candidatus Latescibacteria bacterium]|nr:hypothetical protein [Candidatus Latescibacterota bacterium]
MSRLQGVLLGLGAGGALLLWAAFQFWGTGLVEDLYAGRTSSVWLNGLINRQDIHPLKYYQDKAGQAVRGLSLVLAAAPLMLAGWARLGRRWPASTWNRPLVGGGLVLTGSWALAYWFEVPVFQVLPHWFWALVPKPLPWGWLLLPLLLLAWGVLETVARNPQRSGRNLLLLVGLGFCLQHGLALAEGQGLEALRQRLLQTGHADFVHQALERDDWGALVGGYDRLLESGDLPYFPHATKPPGALLFFAAFAAVGEELAGPFSAVRFATWAAWLLPFLAYAAVVPLYFLARQAMSQEEAWVPAFLFTLVPSTALMALHADQFLYPLLGLIFVYCTVRALWAASLVWGAAAGLAFYLATFTSFALAALGPLVPVLGMAVLLQQGGRHSRRILAVLAWMVVAFGAAYLLVYMEFGYSAWDRFNQALAAHQAWKVGDWSVADRLYFALLNLLEFALWCGLPLALLALAEMAAGLRQWGCWSLQRGLSRGLLVILVLLGIMGKTVAESGRLWLFLVPLVALAAGRQVHRLGGRQWQRTTALVGLLQFIVMVVLKCRQDFFQ